MMIQRLAREVAKWQAEHHGAMPSRVRVSQDIYDELEFDARDMGLTKPDKKYAIDGMKILGVPVSVDPALTLGQCDQ